MNRRDSLKTLAVGSLSAGAILAGSCKNDKKTESKAAVSADKYGRTTEEAERDAGLMEETFFTKDEMTTIGVLCDIIIPADDRSGSATDAKVPDFIEFMVKDRPEYQIPFRGGLRWMDINSVKLFKKSFAAATKQQQLQLVDKIAYPTVEDPAMSQGVAFFKLIRNLTATGFFTSKMGLEDLGYKGNQPNFWDGVPDDVLKQYGLEYDQKTLDQCLKAEDRGKIMTWDT
jgi:gluconate 2-dehydrogenase gamma chain